MSQKLQLLFTLLSFSSIAVFGQEVKDYDDMSVEELMSMSIKTASASEEKANDAPNTTYIVTSQDIKERGYRILKDVLEDLPDFEFQEKSEYSFGTCVSVRGIFSQSSFILLRDGIRVNSMGAMDANMDQNYSVRGAERVEVVMGPSSAIYGADAFTAVINIVTPEGGKINGGAAQVGYGMYGTTDNYIQFGTAKGKFSVSGALSYFGTADPTLPNYYRNDYRWYHEEYLPHNRLRTNAEDLQDTSSVVLPGSATPWNSNRTALTANVKIKYGGFEFGFMGSDIMFKNAVTLRPEFALHSVDNKIGQRNGTIYLKYFMEKAGKWSSETTILGNHFSQNPKTRYQLYYNNYGAGYTYSRDNGIQVNSNFTYNFNSYFKMVGGASYRRLWIQPETTDLPIPFDASPDPRNDPRYVLFGTDPSLERVNTLFYFINDENIGGFSQIQGNFNNIVLFSAGVRADNNNRFGFVLNPRASITLKPSKKLQARFQYGEAFASPAPSFTDFYYGGMEPVYDSNGNFERYQGSFFQIPNPKLKPNKLRSAEFNFVYGSPNLKIALGGYLNNIENIPVERSLDSVIFLNRLIISAQTWENAGTQNAYGITARVDFRKQFEEYNMAFNGYASFTYSKGNITKDSNGVKIEAPISYSAPYTFRVGATYRWKDLSVHLRGFYRGSNLANRSAGQVEIPAFFLMSGNVSYQVFRGEKIDVQAFVQVRNLLDTRYYNASYGDPDAFDATPQDPIRIMVGVSAGFGGQPKKEGK